MRAFVVLTSVVLLAGCGSSDESKLFGGSGGQDGGATGGNGGVGATGGSGTGGRGTGGSGTGGRGTGGTGTGGTGAGGTGTGGTGTGGTGTGGTGTGGTGTGGTGTGGTGTGGTGTGGTGTGGTGTGGTGTGGTGTGGTGTGGTGTGGATSLGLCPGHCGDKQPVLPENCFCDDACVGNGDCCADYGPACHKVSGPGQVTCGGGTCSVGSQFCCQQFGSGGTLNPHCQTANTQCQGPDIYCDGPADCDPGQVCCSTVVGNQNVNFTCEAPSQCSDPSQRIVCGNDPSACQPGQKCVPHPWVPQYNYCAVN